MTDHNLYTIIPVEKRLLKFSEAKRARAFYKNHYIDLLTGELHSFEIEGWLTSLNFPVSSKKIDKRFIHLFYEIGFLFEQMIEEVSSEELLALDLEYTMVGEVDLDEDAKKIVLSLVDAPHYFDYQKKFQAGYEELTAGNCYQFNLTGEYTYSFDDELAPMDFISALWDKLENRGAYASATYIESLEKLFLSNSPECLFQYDEGSLTSMPIKGTLRRHSYDKLEIRNLWRELTHDKKSQAELYMISDLIKNDLCRIDLPVAQVTKKKALLLVPGLIHQYSEIKISLRSHITLKNIIEKMFPGGSITGAPKKRVMKILKTLENRTRGFYCSSTLLISNGKASASINIRSSVIDFKNCTLSYQAGGGITLESTARSEFDEMTYKHDSYIDILTL